MQFLIFTTQSDFDSLNATFNSAFGYPTADGRTLTYASPMKHPTNGEIAMLIEDRCLSYLSSAQTSALQSLAQMQGAGWFPSPMGA